MPRRHSLVVSGTSKLRESYLNFHLNFSSIENFQRRQLSSSEQRRRPSTSHFPYSPSIRNDQANMKSSLFLFLSLFLTVDAFAPASIRSAVPAHSKITRFMAGPDLLEKDVTKPSDAVEVVAADKAADECEIPEEMSETEKLLKQIKEAGTAGFISYAGWELAFWTISIPVCVVGYTSVTGHFPDFSNKEDMAKLGGEAFAFVNFARFAVPLRIGLALSTTPWVQENIVERFMKKEEEQDC